MQIPLYTKKNIYADICLGYVSICKENQILYGILIILEKTTEEKNVARTPYNPQYIYVCIYTYIYLYILCQLTTRT